jgi:hypothetical protein
VRAVRSLPWLLLFVIWATFSARYAGDGVPYYRDILRTNLPLDLVIGSSLRDGVFPQWFPYDGLGLPLIGNAEGLFRPFTLLYVALPDTLTALKIEIVLSTLGGLLGFFLLCRRLQLGDAAASFGAVAFAFTGYPLSLQTNTAFLAPYHTLPWVVFGAIGVLRCDRPGSWAAFTSVCWAMLILAGDPQLGALAAVAIAVAVIADKKWNRVPWLLATVPLTAALCAVWLLPASSLFSDSLRRVWKVNPMQMALHPRRLPQLLVGGVTLDPDHDVPEEIWSRSIFIGASVMAAAALAVRKKLRPAILWFAAGTAFVWLSLGPWGGLHSLLLIVAPPAGSFRYPEKFLSMSTFAFSVAAAFGVAAVRQATRREVIEVLTGVAIFCAVGVAASMSVALAVGGAVTVAFLLANFVLLRRPTPVALAASVLLAIELLVSGWHLLELVPRQAMAEPPPFCEAASKAGAGLGGERVFTSAKTLPGYSGNRDAERWVRVTSNLMTPDSSALCGIESVFEPNLPGVSVRLWAALKILPADQFAALYSAGLRVVDWPQPHIDGGKLLDVDGPNALIRIPSRPRAYFAKARWVEDGASALEALPTLSDDEAVIEGKPPEMPAVRAGHARIVSYLPEQVRVETQSDSEGLLVLNDLAAPGWRASIDGVETAIYRANYLVRGVRVPAGKHQVHFQFETPGLATGAMISALAVLAAMLLVYVARAKHVRAASTSRAI